MKEERQEGRWGGGRKVRGSKPQFNSWCEFNNWCERTSFIASDSPFVLSRKGTMASQTSCRRTVAACISRGGCKSVPHCSSSSEIGDQSIACLSLPEIDRPFARPFREVPDRTDQKPDANDADGCIFLALEQHSVRLSVCSLGTFAPFRAVRDFALLLFFLAISIAALPFSRLVNLLFLCFFLPIL